MRRSSSKKAPSNQVALPAEYRADRDDGVRGKPKSRLSVSRKKGSRFKDDGELDDMYNSHQSRDLQCVDRWGESSPPREGGAEEARQEQALALDALPHNLPQEMALRRTCLAAVHLVRALLSPTPRPLLRPQEPAAAPTYRSAGVASATSSFGALALDTAPPHTVPPSRTPGAVPSGPPPMTEEERAAYLRLFGGAARGTRTLSRRAAGPVFAKAKMAEGEVDAIWVYAAAATHTA